MAKGRSYEELERELGLPPAQPVGFGDICVLAIPVPTYRALMVEATKRNITLAELVQRAFDTILRDGSSEPSRPESPPRR